MGRSSMNRTSPVLPFLFALLILHTVGRWEVPSAPSFPRKSSCKATKMSQNLPLCRLSFSRAPPAGKTCIQAQVKSPIISSLQAGRGGALRGVHGRDWGAGVEEVQQILSGFLLINWAVFTPGTFLDSQKVSLCVQLWGEKKHSTWLHQIMDLISETPFLVTN